jgi:8-oxo-dGTP pyrophosphatase MutT (NUDIX family)
LEQWKLNGKRGLWLTVPVTHSAFIAIAAQHGFSIHHASDKEGVVMTRWLPEKEQNPLPQFCHSFVGIGGFVTNTKGQILVVRERYSIIESKPYKLPGGMVDPGEELSVAIQREVREETGVHATFKGLITFRHAHGVSFGKSDLYFVARLEAENDQIEHDPKEIDECRWITPEEYLADPHVTAFNKRVCKLALQHDGKEWKAYSVPNWSNTGFHIAYNAEVDLD